jgi:hypothetical protein
MRITVENYEAYLLDALEGRLNPAEEAALELFFQAHPELDERDALDEAMPMLEAQEHAAFNKEQLLKGAEPVGFVHAGNYEEAFVSSVEGLLTDDEEAQLGAFVRTNPHLERDAKLYGLTKLVPVDVTLPNKEKLKKTAPVVPLFKPQTALRYAAAVALLIVGLSGWWFTSNTKTGVYNPRMADVALNTQTQSDVAFRIIGSENTNDALPTESLSPSREVSNEPLKQELLAEAPVNIQPKSTSALPVESSAEIRRTTIPEFYFEAPQEEPRSFFAGLIDEVKERLPQRQTDTGTDEPLFAKATEPVIDAVNQTIRYENLESDSLNRKGWLLALGPVTLSRVRYE